MACSEDKLELEPERESGRMDGRAKGGSGVWKVGDVVDAVQIGEDAGADASAGCNAHEWKSVTRTGNKIVVKGDIIES